LLLLLAGALAHDGRVQARAEIIGKFVEFGVAVDFDGVFGGGDHNVAFVAPGEVLFKFGAGALVNDAIQIIS
jgi:hypothetical protein